MSGVINRLVTHDEPTKELLRGAGHTTTLGESRVDYLAFAGGNADAVPVVLIGGAFQTFWSFHRDVERLRHCRPVILLNLPGQGSNTQSSDGMDFSAFADLTRQFLDYHDIGRIVPIGLSYGSGIAHRFAVLYPDRADRLILGGTAPRLQPSLRAILRAARFLDQQGHHEEWAWSCVFHLINLEARDETGVPDDLLDRFHRSLMRMPAEAHERWWTNSERLFTEELSGAPACRSLVFGCIHDHFMPPFQAADVARACEHASFGVLRGVDHLAPLERPDRVLDLYETFLADAPLDRLEWFIHGADAFTHCRERRICMRADVDDLHLEIHDFDGNRSTATVRNIGHHGAAIRWDGPFAPPAGPAPFHIRMMPDDAASRAVFCPGSEATRIRFLFTEPAKRRHWVEAVDRRIRPRATAPPQH